MTPRGPASAAGAQVGADPGARAAPRRQERGRRRAESILDAAEAAIDEIGYDGVTTNLIATRAGISPGSLYQYFANKQAIAEALATRYLRYLDRHGGSGDVAVASGAHGAAGRARGEILPAGLATRPTAEIIDWVVDPVIELNVAHPAAKALLAGSNVSPELAHATRALHAAICDPVDALIAAIAPQRAADACHLAANVSFQIFTGVLPGIVAAAPTERPAVIRELKAALCGYWETLRPAAGQPAAE
ncbi:HTH tetR-type domain-containing protein [Frankia sp. AiPs1]|uniref:TetR/AcrR family transcriptional regulator n=1 Tax=Frankia sp. AiPa1 TaxID=573492 RepID=UPI00202B0058|nr:TetR/AcrR family transcriptional regulator [Frankia sp. AiPa1]MCL9760025.1 TetR/AcrR family transcriptional regulator [Frankia sp. AiPa1]